MDKQNDNEGCLIVIILVLLFGFIALSDLQHKQSKQLDTIIKTMEGNK